jgi:hypothetical protein
MARRSRPPFTGVRVSLITLFHGNGDPDAPATAELAAKLVELRVQAVELAGASGDAEGRSLESIATPLSLSRRRYVAGEAVASGPTAGARLFGR